MLSRPASSYPWVVPLPSPTICLPCNLVTYKGSGSGLSLSADPFNVGVGKGEQPAMLMTRRAGSEWTQALLEVTTSSSTAGFLIPAQSAADVNLNLVKLLVGYPPGETVVTASIVFEVPDPLDPGHTFIREEPVYFDAPVTPVPLMRQSHLAALFGCFLLVGLGSLLVRKRSDRPFPPRN